MENTLNLGNSEQKDLSDDFFIRNEMPPNSCRKPDDDFACAIGNKDLP